MRCAPRRAPARPRLVLGNHAADEVAADRSAHQFLTGAPGSLARPIAGLGGLETGQSPAPDSVEATIREPGRPLGPPQRGEFEHHFGRGLGDVRVHTGAMAERSSRDVDALAYSVGNHVVLGTGRGPTGSGHVMAHEIAHVVHAGPGNVVRRYRPSTAMAFGELDSATLKEQSFDPKTDKKTKPWIELVTVKFGSTSTDSDGNTFWQGTATAEYHANPAKLAAVSFTVTGGSSELGRTDAGEFTVHRIEGYGYNSGSASGTPGVDFQWSEREGPNRRYTKRDPSTGVRAANMSFAVFYNGGEALHVGPLDFSSHGCVHVDWTAMQQVNYHSVVGLTKVKVSYPVKP
jgi:hypothetical protein